MSTPAALETDSGFLPETDDHAVKENPSVCWKLGLLVVSGLPAGPAAWAIRTPVGQTLVRGWISTDSGRAAIQLPFMADSFLLEIRSSSSRWSMEIPRRR